MVMDLPMLFIGYAYDTTTVSLSTQTLTISAIVSIVVTIGLIIIGTFLVIILLKVFCKKFKGKGVR